MAEVSKLTREVELPQPRSSGAALVAVASLAMFTAVGASAFVVRERMEQGCPYQRTHAAMSVALESPALERAFLAAAERGDVEAALEVFARLPQGDASAELAAVRGALAATFRDEQLAQIEDEVQRGECAAVEKRLAHLRQLLPEADLPVAMDGCDFSAPRVTVRFVPAH